MNGNNEAMSIEDFVASLAEGHDDLGARIRTVTHTEKSTSDLVTLRAHYIAFRNGQPTVGELVEILTTKLVQFCLPRKHNQETKATWTTLTPNKIQESAVSLHQEAVDLFKVGNRNTNRNGEFGELIVFLLIESVLRAPQFVAKMSLKTNAQMPVHGSDGIHMRYEESNGKLILYWGESKCYASINAAIDRAAESVAENLLHDKMGHEVFLIKQNFDLSGFPKEFRESILAFLNPYDEKYNRRSDVSVIFIAFDFDAFATLHNVKPDEVEAEFLVQLRGALPGYATRLDQALAKENVKNHDIEVFFSLCRRSTL